MDPEEYAKAFEMIATAGNAKSNAMLAIRAAADGDFDTARSHLADADEDLHAAHTTQTDMLVEEARGNPIKVNIILVHAQDHLTGAMLIRDLADELLKVHEKLAALSS